MRISDPALDHEPTLIQGVSHQSDQEGLADLVLAENIIRSGQVVWQCLSTCLGYVARLHGAIDQRVDVALVKRLLSDPVLGGVAQDALDDMGSFARGGDDS